MSFPIRRTRRPSSLSLSVSSDSGSTTGAGGGPGEGPSDPASPRALLKEAMLAHSAALTSARTSAAGMTTTPQRVTMMHGQGSGNGREGDELVVGGRRGSLLAVGGGSGDQERLGNPDVGDESALCVEMEEDDGAIGSERLAGSDDAATFKDRSATKDDLHDLLSSHLKEYKLASSAAHVLPSTTSTIATGPDGTGRQTKAVDVTASDLGTRVWGMPDWRDAVKGEEERFEYGSARSGSVGGYDGGESGSVAAAVERERARGGVKVISIDDLVPLLQHYHKLDTPSAVLFPWMHGLGDGPSGPAGGLLEEFFGWPSLDAPKYRGLTILKAESDGRRPLLRRPSPLESRDRKMSLAMVSADMPLSRTMTPVPQEKGSSGGGLPRATAASDELDPGRTRADSVSTYASSEDTLPSLSSFGRMSSAGLSYEEDADEDDVDRTDGLGRWKARSQASSMSSVVLDLNAPQNQMVASSAEQDLDSMQGMHPTCAKTTVPTLSCPARGLAATVSRLLGKAFDHDPDRRSHGSDAQANSPEEPPTPTEYRLHFDVAPPRAYAIPPTRRPEFELLRRSSAPDFVKLSPTDMSRSASAASSVATPETPTSASPSERTSILRTSSAMGRARSPSPMPTRASSPALPGNSGYSTPTSPLGTSSTMNSPDPDSPSTPEGSAIAVDGVIEPDPEPPTTTQGTLINALRADAVLDTAKPGNFRKPDMSGDISLRNLSIQEIKYATISDLVIYGEHGVDDAVLKVAHCAIDAQAAMQSDREHLHSWERAQKIEDEINSAGETSRFEPMAYSVFVVKESLEEIAARHPALVSGAGHLMKRDLFQREVLESNKLAKASEIAKGVWLGNSNDNPFKDGTFNNPSAYDVIIEAHDTADMPSEQLLADLRTMILPTRDNKTPAEHSSENPIFLECCSSSRSVGSAHHTLDVLTSRILSLTEIIHEAVNSKAGNGEGSHQRELKVLIFCEDGYTETAIFALAYLMVVDGLSLEEAYLRLQLDRNRSFFVYPFDMAFLDQIERRVLAKRANAVERLTRQQRSAGVKWRPFLNGPDTVQGREHGHREPQPNTPVRTWMASPRFDGSLPSRILPHVYLGNLGHAANSRLLKALGITHVVSVGESLGREFGVVQDHYINVDDVATADGPRATAANDEEKIVILEIENVKDDGNDPLRPKISRACDFIRDAHAGGGKTLVHCRVGVSRSATIVLAYLMKYHGMSLIDAYMMTRCRRLNVLIQPHLRFLHELLGWEIEVSSESRMDANRYNWPTLCRDLWQLNHRFLVR